MSPAHSPQRGPLSPRTQALLALVQGLLPVMTAIVGAIWIAWTYLNDQRAQAEREAESQANVMKQAESESRVRLLEAQKPFLDKKLQIFFETASVAGNLVNAKPNEAASQCRVSGI